MTTTTASAEVLCAALNRTVHDSAGPDTTFGMLTPNTVRLATLGRAGAAAVRATRFSAATRFLLYHVESVTARLVVAGEETAWSRSQTDNELFRC
jgi:hypothetical protein